MAFYQDMPWHDGEEQMQKALRVPDMDNPTVPTMSPQLANHLQIAPLVAIGTLDSEGRPWTTLWGNGDHGLARPLAQNIIGIKTAVTGKHDPVVEELVGKEATGEVVKEEGEGRMVSGLTVDLETRKRVKLYGRMIAGALSSRDDEVTGQQESIAETQLVLKIEQSLGNCPKYLNSKKIVAASSHPELISDSPQLPQQALDLLAKADLFFISSSQAKRDMDTNHRGGPPGFVRVLYNDASGAEIVYPEYSGNRLYQTLGNLAVTPLAGICVPDFETGDMLYLTGTTSTLIGADAAALLPRSNLAVKIKITAARYVARALPFRGTPGRPSPYNPKPRYLATEQAPPGASKSTQLQQAHLLSQTKLTPTISRFRFALSNPAPHKAGQYATFDFSPHLDIGYSHMRDDDPGSINDDFVRTFTVSSPPGDPPNPVRRLRDDEFEVTVRKVGRVTGWLFGFEGSESQNRNRGVQELEVGLIGFGGEFEVVQRHGEERVCFVAAGVGATPLLPSLGGLDFERLEVLWAVRKADLGLVEDVVGQHPDVAARITVFVSDGAGASETGQIRKLNEMGVSVQTRRMEKNDFNKQDFSRYYLCTPVPMRKQLETWLEGKELVFEDFNF